MSIINIVVQDMSTDHDADAVLRAIHSVPGVTNADVNLEEKIAAVVYDDAAATEEDFLNAIQAEGFSATSG